MSATATTAETKTETSAPAVPMVNVQIDGEWKQFPKGTRLIEACMKAGSYVPHYCYHPALSSPGNCRMCLIEMGTPKMSPDRKPELGEDGRPVIAWSPRPAISCAIEVSEGSVSGRIPRSSRSAARGSLSSCSSITPSTALSVIRRASAVFRSFLSSTARPIPALRMTRSRSPSTSISASASSSTTSAASSAHAASAS